MIGPERPIDSGNAVDRTSTQRQEQTEGPDLLRWAVALGIGGAATIGIVILVFLVALVLQPPTWVQVVLGIVLAIGAAIFTWLVAKAWHPGNRGETRRSRDRL